MKINPETLTAAGYRSFPHHKGEGCTHFYQRTILSLSGVKLYFINVYLWDFSQMSGLPDRKSVEIEVSLYKEGSLSSVESTDIRMRVPVWNPNTDITSVELLVAKVYNDLGCIPDIHNN